MQHKLLFIFLFICTFSFSQTKFPQDWVGQYSGSMIIGIPNKPNKTLDVDFEILEIVKDSIWSHKMTFYSEEYGTIIKDYRIVSKDKNNQQEFILDEQNGIVMELRFLNDCFYGMYTVQDFTYSTTLRHQKDGLLWDLYVVSNKKTTASQTTASDNQPAIEVVSMHPIQHQTVKLTKID